jgi:drug/metabolite transporter (DMT)-like permease
MMRIPSAYLTVIAIWSTTPIGLRFSVDSLDFIQASAMRMWASAIICLVLLALWRIPLPFHRAALKAYAAGAIGVAGAMLCAYWGAQYVPSGIIAVMWGLSPILVAVYAWFWLNEKQLNSRKLLSIVMALGGLLLIFAGNMTYQRGMTAGLLVTFVAVNLHCISSVILQGQKNAVHPLAQTTGTLLIAAPVYALAWFLFSGPLPEVISDKSRWAIIYLATFGSVLGFLCYFYLLRHMSAATVALTTLITPVLAMALGSVLEHEVLPWQAWLGALVIMAALLVYHSRTLFLLFQGLLLLRVNKN